LLSNKENSLIVPFTTILEVSEHILGEYMLKWPLTKILDIGGKPVKPNFSGSSEEVPPIPAHVHNGYICDGKACGSGKKEVKKCHPMSKLSTGLFFSTPGYSSIQ
jgi:hypothetical protein